MVIQMEKWADENIGKMFINERGKKAKFISRGDGPSVTLEFADGSRGGFGIGSLNDNNWKLYEEKDDLFTEEALKIKKALKFVEHLENHPEVKNAPINAGIPMCKICDKTIDEIYEGVIKKEDNRVKLKERSERDKIRYVIDKYMDNELDLNEAILQLKTINSLEEDNWNLADAIKKWLELRGRSIMDKELFFILKKNNQKVKEDLHKTIIKELDGEPMGCADIYKILDNRAGKLN